MSAERTATVEGPVCELRGRTERRRRAPFPVNCGLAVGVLNLLPQACVAGIVVGVNVGAGLSSGPFHALRVGTGRLHQPGTECLALRGVRAAWVDEVIVADCTRTSESVDSVRKSVDGIRVVEGLSTQSSVQRSAAGERGAVVNVGVRLDDPDKFLAGMVEVELNLVR